MLDMCRRPALRLTDALVSRIDHTPPLMVSQITSARDARSGHSGRPHITSFGDPMSVIVHRDLSVLFDPKSVVVLGASNDESKYGNWLSVQALRMSDSRSVVLVNRRGEEVLGRPTVRSVAEVDQPVDLVVITVPASGFEQAVDDALAAGARAIIGVTSGFAERGAEGRAVQDRIVERVRAAGAVLIGPNCLGVSDSSTGLTLTSNEMSTGRVALLSQSGNMALEFNQELVARGHGLSRFVSLGNRADVGLAELIRSCAEHDGTDVIAVYCEDFGDGREFVAAATEAARKNKPVLLLTVGSSEASVRGAKSHTGSLTSSSAVVDAACEVAGVYRVASPRALADTAAALISFGASRVDNIVIVADGGGHSSVASDLAEAAGVAVPPLPATVSADLATVLPSVAEAQNPVDIGGGAQLDISTFASIADRALRERDVDAVMITGYFGGYEHFGPSMAAQEMATVEQLIEVGARHSKPLLVHSMYPNGPAAQRLRAGGIPVSGAIEDVTACLGAFHRWTEPRDLPLPELGTEPTISDADYWISRKIFTDIGVEFPAARLISTIEEAIGAAREVRYPVAVKAMGLLHKSDSGGVALGIADENNLVAVLNRMQDSLAATHYTVEAMADLRAGVELIVGVQEDPRFGPVVMVGMGGVFTEVFADVSFALAPVDEEVACDMLHRLRVARLLGEFRGRPALDVTAAARTIAAISRLAVAHPEITEMEINPLLVTPHGAQALDARIVLTNP
ncbi:acetate--CoA ligase family protein [Nocardia rhamnosiphila]